ncbi:hypothetical protein J4526_08595 [Desulfurococcaceae archaeon MEX13E-LK6-19]|nr:hypothetical protein J4526_08595 [Desulfurococcaceae archaeon MEX13E-LK6-19]
MSNAKLVKYLTILAIILVVVAYPVLLTFNINVYHDVMERSVSYPYELVYTIKGSTNTMQFSILYNGSFTIVVDKNGIWVKNFTYNYNIYYYVPEEQVDKKELNENLVNETMFKKLFMLSNPLVYSLGNNVIDELLASGGNLVVIDNVALMYRGEDTIKLEELANAVAKVIIMRAGEYKRDNITAGELPLVITIHKYTGIALKAEYYSSNKYTTIRVFLTNYSSHPLKEYFLYAIVYERLVDVDYGKHIIFNTVLFFGTIIVWSMLVGELGEKTCGRKTYVLMIVSGLTYAIIALMIASGYKLLYMVVVYYLSLAILLSCLSLWLREYTGSRQITYTILLSSAGLLVLLIYTLMMPLMYAGSLYKIGIESGVITENETVLSPYDLIQRGLDPLIVVKENLYYSVEGVNAVLIPILFSSIPLILSGVIVLRYIGKKLDAICLIVLGLANLAPGLVVLKFNELLGIMKNSIINYKYYLITLGLDLGTTFYDYLLTITSIIVALLTIKYIVFERTRG